jgi:hypothetical protein
MLRYVTLALVVAAAGSPVAQEPVVPSGNWQSATGDTYTNALHPVLTGAEFYLSITVSPDGTFRGEWREYSCSGAAVGAFGITTFPCRSRGTGEVVSGRFGPSRQGVIDFGRLGRGAFTWSLSVAEELAIELPKNWQGDAILYRARMTRDGKPRPPAVPSPGADGDALLSANALYREFNTDSRRALERHAGRTLVLEGRRGTLIPLSDGGAAIHIADGFTSRALVLVFANLKEVSGIAEGTRFSFRCRVDSFDYQYVHLNDCIITR